MRKRPNKIFSLHWDALYNKVNNGDIFFHFSPHGRQIQHKMNRDEADGYDEALIPTMQKA